MKVIVYTTDCCPKCGKLKEYLASRGVEYTVRDMQDPKNRAILMAMNVFTVTAPILDADGAYLETDDLFVRGELNTQLIDGELCLNASME